MFVHSRAQCLGVLNCSVAAGERHFVASAYNVECGEGSHSSLRLAALIELTVVVPALPVFLMYCLSKAGLMRTWTHVELDRLDMT